jgi:Ca-activated chloride channel family protein
MPSLPDLSGLAFAQPKFLWLLLLVPVAAWLKGKLGGTPGILFSTTKTIARIGARRRSRAGDFLTGLLYLALVCLILAMARPQLGKTITRTLASGIDIMLAIDVSKSMLAEDFTIGTQRANRLEAAKRVTEEFIRQRPNDRIGIVGFAGRPYLVSPLTLDHDWLLQNLERIQIGLVEDGTAIGSALASASSRLKDKEAKSKLVVLLTDGENNAGRVTPMTAAEAAKALGIKVYTVGSGTRGIAPYPVIDQSGRVRGYQQIQGEFDEETLRNIAAMTGGTYFRATDTKSLEKIFQDIDQLEKSEVEIQKVAQYRDLFPWFVLVGTVLLAAETLLGQTIWRRLP